MAKRHRMAKVLVTGLGLTLGTVLWFGDDGDHEEGPSDQASPEEATAPDLDGLADGQVVEIAVGGLEGDVATVTVQCDATTTAPAAGCDPTTAHHATSTADGTVRTEHEVWRVITTPGAGTIDCARQACELRTYPARTDATVPSLRFGFDDNTTARLPVSVTTTDSEISHRRTLTLHAVGLPDTALTIRGCATATGTDPFACESLFAMTVSPTDGVLEHEIHPADWERTRPDPCALGCRIDFEAPDLARPPSSIHLPADPDPPTAPTVPEADLPTGFDLSVSTGLRDGEEVTISIPGFDLEPGFDVLLCTDTTTFECTWLDASVTDDTATVSVPRLFMSWRSGRHDCLVTPCSLMVTSPRFALSNPLTHEISFDPDAPVLDGVAVTLQPAASFADGQVVTVTFDPLPEEPRLRPLVSVCAVDRPAACEVLASDDWTIGRTRVELRRSLITPIGRHSCVADGPCELVLWTDSAPVRFEPVPLTFDLDAPPVVEATTVEIRPGGPLTDGQTIEITVRGIRPAEDPYLLLCATDSAACVGLGSLWLSSGDHNAVVQTPIRRIVTVFDPADRAGWRVVDCAVEACEVRLGFVRHHQPRGLTFDPDTRLPPPVLAIDRDGPVPVDEPFILQGRGFTFTGSSGDDVTGVDLCRGDVDIADLSGCYSIGPFTSLQHTGPDRFAATVEIPRSPPVYPGVAEDQQCRTECAIVVITGLGEPAILPVTIDRG